MEVKNNNLSISQNSEQNINRTIVNPLLDSMDKNPYFIEESNQQIFTKEIVPDKNEKAEKSKVKKKKKKKQKKQKDISTVSDNSLSKDDFQYIKHETPINRNYIKKVQPTQYIQEDQWFDGICCICCCQCCPEDQQCCPEECCRQCQCCNNCCDNFSDKCCEAMFKALCFVCFLCCKEMFGNNRNRGGAPHHR